MSAIPKVAIGLITCGRENYTWRTLASLRGHNDLSKFTLLHADDASKKDDNKHMAADAGFKCITSSDIRSGALAMRRSLCNAAILNGAEWLWLLENDWESDRGFPWGLFRAAAKRYPEVYCLRLYWRLKERGGRPTCDGHAGIDKRVAVKWEKFKANEPAEIGNTHWGCPPSVTHLRVLKWLLHSASDDRDAMRQSAKIKRLTVRPTKNVLFHIGEDHTPDFKF